MEPLKGVVHGTSIELASDPGLPDGQQVEISVRLVPQSNARQKPGDGLKRAAGALTDWSEEDDRILDEIARARQTSTRPLPDDEVDAAE